jgi:predicted aspartyl protease
MTVTNLRKLSYHYTSICPQIPVNFFDSEGNPTQTFNDAILDSGAATFAIPKWLANELNLHLKKRPQKGKSAGGEVDVYTTKANFNIGRSGIFVNYSNVEISVLETLDSILIGMVPVFEDFIVTIDGKKKKILLEPRK